MANPFDVSQEELVQEIAKDLKKLADFKPPDWAIFVKTGHFKQRPPVDKDWWYLRAASVFRKIYLQGPIGVSKLRTLYGGKKNRGAKPEHFCKASGNILRKILQQLEKAGFAIQASKGGHRGRILTPKGKSLVDKAARRLIKPSAKTAKPEAPAKDDGESRRDTEAKA